MRQDINVDKVRANCFRQSKIPGEFMLQMRAPGGSIEAKHLTIVKEIAEKYGDGTFHIGTRQTLNVPGIKYTDIGEVNRLVAPYIREIETERCGIELEDMENGYPTLAARNIMGCIGAAHCLKANAHVGSLADKLEKVIFPSDYHIKICIAGCPNDCIKAHMSDFGILGVTIPQYDKNRCISCGACVRACDGRSTGALSLDENKKVIRNTHICIGCGECVEACPTRAFSRSEETYYRILIGGRTSRKSPRVGKVFLDLVTEEVVLKLIGNWKEFSANTLDYKPVYIHGGHLMDMAGYRRFKEMMLKGIELNPEAKVATRINWSEQEYRANMNVK